MKKIHIFGIVVIAIAISLIVSTLGNTSSYVNFQRAKEVAEAGNNKEMHVVGQLKKNASGEVVGIKVNPDKVSFSFIMVDNDGEEQKVYYNEPMPTDFYRTEQVVVIGGFKGETFLANKILMKCPSKYQETTV
ncbi:cytochrome c maturation protein CcmE domain-containing protein [Aureibacter tunicatorum]|uniref:Cytochrome c-type biogenesis protein CcmE n=1 Tax=Aureibacter tunicatorum TaxID=866807 RepID=A0AAE4BRE9_9BACT|nr:cytochrome c maturation protein CcmE [Aureibacter tunicatorum]MDR6240144.1 cytochrome c-type biogenesis protein CcmE [Aureibacter tunicatorum]BDD05975.1 hypothetical protein AUTU_34580 [Aureibacter tunicatorum]